MLLLNSAPIEYQDDKLLFYATQYSDGTLAIVCETDNREPYATISINLSSYDIKLDNVMIILNHDLSISLRDVVLNEFSKCSDEIEYGHAKSIVMYLKDEYIEKIKSEEDTGNEI